MDQTFLLKLALSFIIGGFWTVVVTIIADRLGSKIGGLLVGLPSTALFGLLFIAWAQSTDVSIQATTIMPIQFGISLVFLSTYAFLLKNNIWSSLFLSLVVWFVLSSILIFLKFDNFSLSILGYVIFFLLSYIVFEKILKIKSSAGKKIQYTPSIIVFRGLFSGIIVALVVLFSKLAGPMFGGILSAFPALFTSTLIIVFFSQGAKFSKALAKSAMINTSSIVIYAIAVRFTYGNFGIILGTIISTIASILSSIVVFHLLIKRTS